MARCSKRPRRSTPLSDHDNSENEVNALKSRFRAPSPDESVEEEPPLHLFFDSLKPNFSELDTSDSETESNVDDSEDDWDDGQLLAAMLKMEDMLRDPDWVPEHLRKKAEIRAKSKIGEPLITIKKYLAYLSNSKTQDLCQYLYKSIRTNCSKAQETLTKPT